jgi:hypothetical protein
MFKRNTGTIFAPQIRSNQLVCFNLLWSTTVFTSSFNIIWKDKYFICKVSLVLRTVLSYTLLTGTF